ncbi:MAG: hypothetical protein JXR96_22410, partial [Deltaproteobacteria bacterium]|nr:hypothetical protein [Deltaproteobacteria bacterium]
MRASTRLSLLIAGVLAAACGIAAAGYAYSLTAASSVAVSLFFHVALCKSNNQPRPEVEVFGSPLQRGLTRLEGPVGAATLSRRDPG